MDRPGEPVTQTDLETAAEPSRDRLVQALTIVLHPDLKQVGASHALVEGRPCPLGRTSDVFGAGALDVSRVSREHALVEHGPAGLVVRDQGSRNGTTVNGRRIDQAPVVEGDVITIGPIIFRVGVRPLAPPERRSATMVGRSAPMARLLTQIDAVAGRDTPVLVVGETGVGKELVAREIHAASGRRGAFVAVNCGGLSDGVAASELFGHARGAFSGAGDSREGLVRSAAAGTLLLDEIGDASHRLQTTLLRLIEEGAYRAVGSDRAVASQARLVAATHVDLGAAVGAGTFRQDLYSRLDRVVLRVPPLRDRLEDVVLLAHHFADRPIDLGRTFARALLGCRWPNNVRQLRAVVEQAILDSPDGRTLPLSDAVKARLAWRPKQASLPPRGRPARPSAERLEALLRAERGNVKAVAAALGTSRNSLYRWIEEAGIDLKSVRG